MEDTDNLTIDSEYELIEKQTIALEHEIHARMLEVAYHESFYALKRKINAIEQSKKSLIEKNMEKYSLSSVLQNVFEMKNDVDKMLFGKGNISQISQKVIDIEIQKFLDSGMTVSELKHNLDNRLKIN